MKASRRLRLPEIGGFSWSSGATRLIVLALLPLVGCSDSQAGPATAAPDGPVASACLAGGDQNTINAALTSAGAVAELCPNAVFELTDSVRFVAADQVLRTQGDPADGERAHLKITSPTLTAAIVMLDQPRASLEGVTVDGSRDRFGYVDPRALGGTGDALILAGGDADAQMISGVAVEGPRSWSALQVFEGDQKECSGAVVKDSFLRPGGSIGSLADGISFACSDGQVLNNTIVDASDGGIVLFGAPGTLVSGNTIRAETVDLLGGINMVDYDPFGGDFTGTRVEENLIESDGATIRIGLAMGASTWACPSPALLTPRVLFGAAVRRNVLSGPRMQYGFVASGLRSWTAEENRDVAQHWGTPTRTCNGLLPAAPRGFLRDLKSTSGSFQSEFEAGRADGVLWTVGIEQEPPTLR